MEDDNKSILWFGKQTNTWIYAGVAFVVGWYLCNKYGQAKVGAAILKNPGLAPIATTGAVHGFSGMAGFAGTTQAQQSVINSAPSNVQYVSQQQKDPTFDNSDAEGYM